MLTIVTLDKGVKVNNKDTRRTSPEQPFSSVSIVDFEQVNVSWEFSYDLKHQANANKYYCF